MGKVDPPGETEGAGILEEAGGPSSRPLSQAHGLTAPPRGSLYRPGAMTWQTWPLASRVLQAFWASSAVRPPKRARYWPWT
jgi:hypothetical protein